MSSRTWGIFETSSRFRSSVSTIRMFGCLRRDVPAGNSACDIGTSEPEHAMSPSADTMTSRVERRCLPITACPSPAVVHAGVLHPQHRSLLGLEEAAVDYLAREKRVVAGLQPVAHLAVEEGDGLDENRCTRRAFHVLQAVERVRFEIDFDRL